MKKITGIKIIIIVISIVFIASCSSTNYLTMTVTEPAPVYLSPGIKKIGIINRSLPNEESTGVDKLDKILSLEGKELDKEGAEEIIRGVNDELKNSNIFDKVKVLNNVDEKGSGLGVFPSTLSWKKVDKICNSNGLDCIFVLSFYDTDTKVNYKMVPVEIVNPLGIRIKAIEHQASLSTLIKTGWRIYDSEGRSIQDEYIMNEKIISTGRGINPIKAVKAVLDRKESVMKISNKMGHNYAVRVFSYDIRVSRVYYVRGTDNFKVAKRRAQTGDWDGAAELWEKELNNPKAKVAGRACYNMAIINEINENLEDAVDWASKSYTDYRDKKALRYLNILKNRIEKNKQLNN